MSYRSAFRNQTGRMPRASDLREPALAAAFSGVIDQVGVSAEAAYSLRKLRTAYTGSAVRVRRETDNAEADIGFTSAGDLDTAALASFAPSDGAFIATWYDQSGNAQDLAQATAAIQPLISFDGEIETINTKPAMAYDGTNQFVNRVGTILTSLFVNAVHKPLGVVSAAQTIIRQNATVSGTMWYLRLELALTVLNRGATTVSAGVTTAVPQITSGTSTNGTNSQLFKDGTSIGTGTAMAAGATNGTMDIGVNPSGGQYYGGKISEVIVFASNLTTGQRQALERNQGTYFGITVA